MSLFDKYRKESKDPDKFVNFIENTFNVRDFKKITAQEYTDKLVIEFKPTDKCNFDCSYCCFHDNRSIPLPRKTFDNYLEILTNRGTDKKSIFLFVYGGEPTKHPDLIEYIIDIVNIYKGLKVKVLIQSNGMWWDVTEYKKACDILDEHGIEYVFSFSFHKEYTKITGIAKRIKYLISRGRFEVMTYMITRNEIKSHISNINIMRKVGIPVYVRTILQESEWFMNSEYKNVITREIDGDSFIIEDKLGKRAASFEDLTMGGYLNFNGYNCSSGDNSILLSANGKIYRCDMDFLYDRDVMYDANISNKIINNTNCKTCTHKFCSIYYGDKWKPE